MPTGGTIRMRAAADDEHGVIEVIDSGPGTSAEVQARVFEPFFTAKGERGTGLGLAMVFGIVEPHGGHIEVHSTPGDGTTFRMIVPLVVVSAGTEPVPTSIIPSPPTRPLRVLVVDDEPMMTKALAGILKPAGHLVSVAGCGEEGLEKLAEQAFEMVVSFRPPAAVASRLAITLSERSTPAGVVVSPTPWGRSLRRELPARAWLSPPLGAML